MNWRRETINLIEILGYPHSEVVLDIYLENIEVSSISFIKETNKLILYKWYSDYEFQFDYDELGENDKKTIWAELSKYLLN